VLGQIWLGDAARAIDALRHAPDGDVAVALRALGFDTHQRAPSTGEPDSPAAAPTSGQEAPPSARPRRAGPRRERPSTSEAADPLLSLPLLEPVARQPVTTTRWEVEPLARPTQHDLSALPPYQPLLAPRSTPAILQTVLSRVIEGGELDIEALVETLARGRPVSELPRRRVRTLRFGVDILCDLGQGMEPFERDQIELVESARRLAGAERVRVTYFADAPLRGAGSGPRWTWEPYRPPNRGMRVIVLSDLGIGGPTLNHRRSRREEWRDFVECVHQHDCDVIGLVPYPPHRWTTGACSLFPLLAWDRLTTTGSAFSVAGRR
jgi:hypothetical protein